MPTSWNRPALANKISEDVPAIQNLVSANLKLDPSNTEDIPTGAKRLVSTASGQQFQVFNGTTWASIGRLNHDVQSVDGFFANASVAANAIAVRDANGALPGNILGNAATATTSTTAGSLVTSRRIKLTGGANGQVNFDGSANVSIPTTLDLDAQPLDYIGDIDTFTKADASTWGHVELRDSPDATLVASQHLAATPACVATVQTSLTSSINSVSAVADSCRLDLNDLEDDVTALDTSVTTRLSTLQTTLTNLINSVCPVGIIVAFSGSFNGNYPIINGTTNNKWALCNGGNGTPNLVGKFILACNSTEIGQTGGSSTHTHSVSGSISIGATTTGATTLSVGQMPTHRHYMKSNQGSQGWCIGDASGSDFYISDEFYDGCALTREGDANRGLTSAKGSSTSHTHSIPSGSGSFGSTSGSTSTLPVYYKLAYIKRIS